jgi:hypothetical protein
MRAFAGEGEGEGGGGGGAEAARATVASGEMALRCTAATGRAKQNRMLVPE